MKDLLFVAMTKMMPTMALIMYLGAAAVTLGVVILMASHFAVSARSLARWPALIAQAVGLFFIGSQLAGMWLQVSPAMNFGDAAKFQFNLIPFWLIGGLVLLGGALLDRFSRVAVK